MRIYFDNNATTRVAPDVLAAMLPWLGGDGYGNPSSSHALGRAAAAALGSAREQVAGLAGCREEEIIFTSCGTESINTAIHAAVAADPDKRHIVTAAVEHSATIKLCEHLARRGYEITWLPVDSEGQLDPDQVGGAVREDTALVTLLWANNETGVLFPIRDIAAITRKKNVFMHVDAVQAFGKIPTPLDGGIDFLSVSGHKLHAPKGVAALCVNRRARMTPLLRGSQESCRRGGTQNVASIVGFGTACGIAAEHLGSRQIREWRDAFEGFLLETVPGTAVNGHRTLRLPNTSNLAFEGIESEGALILLDAAGICCSAGSSCASGSPHPSHVLKAMGMPDGRARASLRFSFGRFNTESDFQRARDILPGVVKKLRSLAPGGSSRGALALP